ncbi:MAG: thiaminase II [Spirochaetales bacterium]
MTLSDFSLSKGFWHSIQDIYTAILHHPFNTELAQGTLDRSRFLFYLQQDTLYLVEYGRTLSMLAAKAPNTRIMKDFLTFASGIFAVEQSMHSIFFKEYGLANPTRVKSPACFAYTNYLLATAAVHSYAEAVAAVLPCFWVYREVGLSIYRSTVPGNPYQQWIDTYAGKQFGEATDRAIALLEEMIQESTKDTQSKMLEAFQTSTRLEWYFWDSAYKMEAWQP